MKETRWDGPGSTITLTSGSVMPPRWALLLIDRVLTRERPLSAWINLRWTNSRRGGHGVCYGPRHIAVHPQPGDDDRTRYIVIHELAHACNGHRDRHGPGFYDALVRIAKAEGSLRLVQREHVKSHAKAPLTRAIARARAS